MCGVGRGLVLHRTCSFNDQFDVVVVLQTGRRDETGVEMLLQNAENRECP